jgi:ankyrin repeat protein
MWAAELNYMEILTHLVKQGATLEAQDNMGYTALAYAAQAGHLAIARYLVEQGANVNVKSSARECTPLHLACLNSDINMFQLFEERGADIFAVDVFGDNMAICTVQHETSRNTLGILKLLWKKGLDIGAPGNDGRDALHYVLLSTVRPPKMRFQLIVYLVRHGADIFAMNINDECALELANCTKERALLIDLHNTVVYGVDELYGFKIE